MTNTTISQTLPLSKKYDYNKVIQYLENKGKAKHGLKYQFETYDIPIITQLIAYFLQDEEACNSLHIDLQKGIMLTGPIGCGKTSLMKILKYIATPTNTFIMKSSREISFEFIKEGFDIIHQYARGKLYASEPRIYCFDDLGSEGNIKYFGNECNVMAEILLSCYDLFSHKGLITHITTNLSATELEENYGNRLRSRLREMVNLISFNKDCLDKRK